MQNKKLLIVAATHGDEKIGVEVVKKLRNKKLGRYFDCLVANPRALRKNTRFIDADLNRSYPGDKCSPLYEKKMAYKNLREAKQYQYVIDIHEARKGINNFIILPRKKLSNKFPINLINIEPVLLWPEPKGPLGQILENVIELEFGMNGKKREKIVCKAENIVANFIKNIYADSSREGTSKKIYFVYGKIMQKDFAGRNRLLKDFRATKIGKEKFYPLLVEQYLNEGIVCYKMKRLKQFLFQKNSDQRFF